MRVYFFDTSALAPRYHGGPFKSRVNRILTNATSEFHLAELSIVEMSSTLAQHCRRQNLSLAHFHTMRGQFEDDIANGLLRVRRVGASDLLNARDLLEDAAVVNRRNLRSADAIIAASCRALAHSLRRRVIFYSRDWGQYSSILRHPSVSVRP